MGVQRGRGSRGALQKAVGQGFSHCHMPTDLWEIMLKCKGCVCWAWTAKPCGGGGPASPFEGGGEDTGAGRGLIGPREKGTGQESKGSGARWPLS